ncbi:MAG TPA: dipeptidase [Candidatus Limnocylindrales bacterium]|nr:dipeptidase [Candidatus Limnocylindrales bacterium]
MKTAPDLRDTARRLMAQARADLETLVRIPSVSHAGFEAKHVKDSAAATAEILRATGLETKILEVEGAHPAVLGRIPAPPGAPTVLLYAHHDVQPTGPLDLWHTKPFEPVEKDGRLWGRGTSDDKCGVVLHAAAVRAFEGRPPVGVTVFVEGEEEAGSPNLAKFLDRHAGELRADAVILADSGNWRVGQPALTTSLRGIVDCVVEVRTLDHAVHSGEYGGAVPDAIIALARTLARLHDDKGNVAVPGLVTGPSDPLDLTEDELRAWTGARPGVELIGDGGLTERMWTRPAISVLGLDAPRVAESTNQLVPSARAKVSMRLAPGEEPDRALDALVAHLRKSVPWGAQATITKGSRGRPYRLEAKGPAFDAMRRAMSEAWGRAPVDMGAGGSIPFVADFARLMPDAALLLTGAADPTSNAHSEDESVDLGELERSILAESLFFRYLAEAKRA